MPTRKPNPEWDPVYFSNYRRDLFSASKWKRQADALFEAAALVEVEVREIWAHNMRWVRDKAKGDAGMRPRASEAYSIYFMLLAFAVENLFKARLIRENYHLFRSQYEQGGKLPNALKSHDLVMLAGKVGFQPTLEEEDLLRRLTRAGVWAGRYPVPTEFRDAANDEEFSDGTTWHVSYFSEDDPERVHRFIARLRTEIGV